MRRRGEQEREEAEAHEQAEARREALLSELKAREAADRAPEPQTAKPEPPEAEPDEPERPATDESADAEVAERAEPETA
ncbi:MAG: hypothetical protein ABI458_07845 [Chloroflexota bacterium]